MARGRASTRASDLPASVRIRPLGLGDEAADESEPWANESDAIVSSSARPASLTRASLAESVATTRDGIVSLGERVVSLFVGIASLVVRIASLRRRVASLFLRIASLCVSRPIVGERSALLSAISYLVLPFYVAADEPAARACGIRLVPYDGAQTARPSGRAGGSRSTYGSHKKEKVTMAIKASAQLAQVKSLILGITKHLSTASTLTLGGSTMAPAALITVLTTFITAAGTLATARAATQTALDDERAKEAAIAGLVKALIAFVYSMYTDATILADFGLPPRKPRAVQTADEKALAAARRLATRKARGTLGKVQKEDIHGTVSTLTVPVPPPPAKT